MVARKTRSDRATKLDSSDLGITTTMPSGETRVFQWCPHPKGGRCPDMSGTPPCDICGGFAYKGGHQYGGTVEVFHWEQGTWYTPIAACTCDFGAAYHALNPDCPFVTEAECGLPTLTLSERATLRFALRPGKTLIECAESIVSTPVSAGMKEIISDQMKKGARPKALAGVSKERIVAAVRRHMEREQVEA